MIFHAKDVDEMRQWSEDIDAQSKLYTDSKRKTAGTSFSTYWYKHGQHVSYIFGWLGWG